MDLVSCFYLSNIPDPDLADRPGRRRHPRGGRRQRSRGRQLHCASTSQPTAAAPSFAVARLPHRRRANLELSSALLPQHQCRNIQTGWCRPTSRALLCRCHKITAVAAAVLLTPASILSLMTLPNTCSTTYCQINSQTPALPISPLSASASAWPTPAPPSMTSLKI